MEVFFPEKSTSIEAEVLCVLPMPNNFWFFLINNQHAIDY